MKVVAVTSCCTRSPAYEMARPLRHDMAIITWLNRGVGWLGRGAGWLARARDGVRHRDHHVASRAEAAPHLRPTGRLLVDEQQQQVWREAARVVKEHHTRLRDVHGILRHQVALQQPLQHGEDLVRVRVGVRFRLRLRLGVRVWVWVRVWVRLMLRLRVRVRVRRRLRLRVMVRVSAAKDRLGVRVASPNGY